MHASFLCAVSYVMVWRVTSPPASESANIQHLDMVAPSKMQLQLLATLGYIPAGGVEQSPPIRVTPRESQGICNRHV
eukprot:COSAG05_NODE_315_length_11604_cov_8.336375_2_plen_77_part_00